MIEIKDEWLEIQTGLYLERYDKQINNKVYTFKILHSADGYCFYDNSLPEEERIYMQYASLGQADSENNYTSTLINPEWEIA